MDLSLLDNPAPSQPRKSLKLAPILETHPGKQQGSIPDQVRPRVEDDLPEESEFSPAMLKQLAGKLGKSERSIVREMQSLLARNQVQTSGREPHLITRTDDQAVVQYEKEMQLLSSPAGPPQVPSFDTGRSS
ncbi:MAG: hypothetical protein Q9173_001900 [Seirophora scorigena]